MGAGTEKETRNVILRHPKSAEVSVFPLDARAWRPTGFTPHLLRSQIYKNDAVHRISKQLERDKWSRPSARTDAGEFSMDSLPPLLSHACITGTFSS